MKQYLDMIKLASEVESLELRKYSKEEVESIENMLEEFESRNIISKENKKRYDSCLEFCNQLDIRYGIIE